MSDQLSSPSSEPSTSALPLLYKALVPFSRIHHAALCFPEAVPNFSYAASANVIPLLAQEVVHAQSAYPILFLPSKQGIEISLVAMTGWGDGVNRFVDESGQWRSHTYIPAWVRRYPFYTAKTAEREEPLLVIDPTTSWLNETGGRPFFEEGVEITERLAALLKFNEEYQVARIHSQTLVDALFKSGVLELGSFRFKTGKDEDKYQEINGFMLVSEAKLQQLDSTSIVSLFKMGALQLAYAQLSSMQNIRNLATLTPPSF